MNFDYNQLLDNFNYEYGLETDDRTKLLQQPSQNQAQNEGFNYEEFIKYYSQETPFNFEQEKETHVEILLSEKQQQSIELTKDCNYDIASLHSDYVNKIKESDFFNFCQNVVISRRSFLSTQTWHNLMQHQTSELSKPLIIGPFPLAEKQVKEIFKHMLQFSLEKETLDNQLFHAKKILEILLKAEIIVKNEQINNNRQRSLIFYLQLSVLISSFIAPSSEYFWPVLNYFFTRSIQNEITLYCKFIIKRLRKTFQFQINQMPSDKEILQIMSLKPMTITISIYANKKFKIEIDPNMTVEDVINECKQHLKLDEQFILILCSQGQETYLSANEYILKIVDQLNKSLLKQSNYNTNNIVEIQGSEFILKNRFFHPSKFTTDINHLTMCYLNASQDFLNGESEMILIASLKLTADIGSFKQSSKIQFDYKEYIPISFSFEKPGQIWTKQIIEMYLKQDQMSKREARRRFVENLKAQFNFFTLRFNCQYFENETQFSRILLHVGHNGLFIYSIVCISEPMIILHYPKLNCEKNLETGQLNLFEGKKKYLLQFSNFKDMGIAWNQIDFYLKRKKDWVDQFQTYNL